jgi:Zn-dependent M32 family carboxypeptidase
VLGRLLARKSCMTAWIEIKKDNNQTRLIEPMATVLDYSRKLADALQDHFNSKTPYDALLEFQTPGYCNPIGKDDLKKLQNQLLDKQEDVSVTLPPVDHHVLKRIIQGLVDVAQVDRFKVEIIDNVAHPACLGYGGVPKGVILGLTYDYDDPILGILTNWHEIGHAVYRQFIPNGSVIHGRAMDEAVAFLFEHVIGRSDGFLKMLLDAGLKECGYDLDLLRHAVRRFDRQTQRIETNPLRHIIDISICDQFERMMINNEIEAEDAEITWLELTKPYKNILPDFYPYYWDVHQMTGIYGDRACYNPGLIAAFQLAEVQTLDITNLNEFVTQKISLCNEKAFDQAIKTITGKPLSIDAFWKWVNDFYGFGA